MTKSRMKNFARNSAIFLYDKVCSRRTREIGRRVISLHEVKDPIILEEKIQWLQEHYELVSLDRLVNDQPRNKPMVAVTFDDGYRSAYDLAIPVLEKHQVPAVFFVCSGFVGLEGGAAREFCRRNLNRVQILPPLTKQQLIDISRSSLFEIGSHTRNHVNLGKDHSESVYVQEIEGDRLQLEDWIGAKVRWFAYPFGGMKNMNSSVRKYLENSPFESAFTIVPGFINSQKNPYSFGRDSLDMTDSTRLWESWLRGSYDGLYQWKEKMKWS